MTRSGVEHGPNDEKLPSQRISLATLAPITSLAGVVLYGIGWLYADAYYGHFGLTPEAAGIGFSYIVVRVAVLLLLLLAFGGLGTGLAALLHWKTMDKPDRWQIAGALVLLWGVLVWVAPGPIRFPLGFLGFVGALALSGELLPPQGGERWKARIGIAAFALVPIALVTISIANVAASSVVEGKAVVFGVGGEAKISPESDLLIARSGNSLPAGLDGSCVTPLGGSGGSLYFFHRAQTLADGRKLEAGVWRIPSNAVYVEGGLSDCRREARVRH